MILAHRDELIQQAVDKLEMVACDAFHDAFYRDDANVGVVKAERNEIDKQVVVGSVQTVSRENRLEQLPQDFDFIITDECHHSAAATYRRIYEYLGVISTDDGEEQKGDALHLGVTATPERTDKIGLDDVFDEIAKHGIRNMTLLTQAPTGSTATMVGTSTGIEPFFDFRYTRKSQLGVDEEYVKVYAEWKEAHPSAATLPDYFVKASDITVDEHVAVQSAVQRWVDASISKTVNLPSNATQDDVSLVFKKLYESGCKGGTVYRDGSRSEQVLNSRRRFITNHNQQESSGKFDTAWLSDGTNLPVPPADEKQSIKGLPYKRQGATVSMKTPSGTLHITMNHDDSGQPFEVFVEIGKGGSDLKAMAEAIGRLISLIFRLEPIPPKERALQVIEQLNGIGGARSVGFGKNKVLSLPDAISKALSEHYKHKLINDAASYKNNPDLRDGGVYPDEIASFRATAHLSADICPVCGQSSLIREEGCTHCRALFRVLTFLPFYLTNVM